MYHFPSCFWPQIPTSRFAQHHPTSRFAATPASCGTTNKTTATNEIVRALDCTHVRFVCVTGADLKLWHALALLSSWVHTKTGFVVSVDPESIYITVDFGPWG